MILYRMASRRLEHLKVWRLKSAEYFNNLLYMFLISRYDPDIQSWDTNALYYQVLICAKSGAKFTSVIYMCTYVFMYLHTYTCASEQSEMGNVVGYTASPRSRDLSRLKILHVWRANPRRNSNVYTCDNAPAAEKPDLKPRKLIK